MDRTIRHPAADTERPSPPATVRDDRSPAIEQHAEEGLIGSREQERRPSPGETVRVSKELQRLGAVLRGEPGVDDDAVVSDPPRVRVGAARSKFHHVA